MLVLLLLIIIQYTLPGKIIAESKDTIDKGGDVDDAILFFFYPFYSGSG